MCNINSQNNKIIFIQSIKKTTKGLKLLVVLLTIFSALSFLEIGFANQIKDSENSQQQDKQISKKKIVKTDKKNNGTKNLKKHQNSKIQNPTNNKLKVKNPNNSRPSLEKKDKNSNKSIKKNNNKNPNKELKEKQSKIVTSEPTSKDIKNNTKKQTKAIKTKENDSLDKIEIMQNVAVNNNSIIKKNENKNAFLNSIFFNDEEFSINSETTYQSLEIALSNYDTKLQDNQKNFKIFNLDNPSRLVIDLENIELKDKNYQPVIPQYIKQYRFSNIEGSLRLVFELQNNIKIRKKSFKDFNNQNLQKIIVEFESTNNENQKNEIAITAEKVTAEKVTAEKVTVGDKNNKNELDDLLEKQSIQNKIDKPQILSTKEILQQLKDNSLNNKQPKNNKKFLIVIDAGHGGKDPGTIGDSKQTQEKDLTLSYALALKNILEKNSSYKVLLTRDKDYFIPLKKRVEIARKVKADIFISMHINWVDNPEISGLSIYTLSEKSSDKQAELLAQKENRADIISGINFSGASSDIMKTLIAMSQRNSMNQSSQFANLAIRIAKKNNISTLQNTHRFAGFAVLTAPDMASVLLELGYISNQKEEELLNQKEYKEKIINSLSEAIDEYFSKISVLN